MRKKYKPGEIRAIRERLGLSRMEMAELMEITPSTVAYWETGGRSPIGPARILLGLIASGRYTGK